MRGSKLLQLLKSFSEEEGKRFEKFLASPYFNNSNKLYRFFKLLSYHGPLYESDKLNKKILYSKLHGKQPYNDHTMRELMSDLLKLANEFVVLKDFKATKQARTYARELWLARHNPLNVLMVSS